MRIEHSKSIKIQSQPSFAGDKPQEKQTGETSSNTGKILLTLGALGALGGGAYLIMKKKKTKNFDDQNDISLENLIKIQILKNVRKDVVPFVRKLAPYSDPKDTKKLLKLGKMYAIERFYERQPKPNLPKLLIIEGNNNLSKEKIAEILPKMTVTYKIDTTLKSGCRKTLEEFYKSDLTSDVKVKKMHVLHEADTIFGRMNYESPKDYEAEVDKMAEFISQAEEKHNTTVVFTVRDANRLPKKLQSLVTENETLRAKDFQSKAPQREQRSWSEINYQASRFEDITTQYTVRNLAQLGHDFDRNPALGLDLPSTIMISQPRSQAITEEILHKFSELTKTTEEWLPIKTWNYKSVCRAMKKAENSFGKEFEEKGTRRFLYIGELGNIFEPAKNALPPKEYEKFKCRFFKTADSAQKKGITTIYTVNDPEKLSDKDLLHRTPFEITTS